MIKENKATLKQITKIVKSIQNTFSIQSRGYGKSNMMLNRMRLLLAYNLMADFIKEQEIFISIDEVNQMVKEALKSEVDECSE